ncbi:hypothetical protein [Stutzerimonas zhaodongensis]|nr:hypothetical protein [Stutzerimonas zhaodongensis]MCQ2030226.1 hypothetical protein [Stutzerimonas zhaodongensis]MCQ4318402.1 hypothetical protein [Stutzerimonas zhaodongensis]
MTKTVDTRELLRADHRLVAARATRRWVWVVLVMLCGFAGLLYMRWEDGTDQARQLQELASDNQKLREALSQSRLQEQEAEATQEQLLSRIAGLSAQIDRLQTELAFFQQQKKSR